MQGAYSLLPIVATLYYFGCVPHGPTVLKLPLLFSSKREHSEKSRLDFRRSLVSGLYVPSRGRSASFFPEQRLLIERMKKHGKIACKHNLLRFDSFSKAGRCCLSRDILKYKYSLVAGWNVEHETFVSFHLLEAQPPSSSPLWNPNP